jgi:hypothetical protein
MIRRLDLLIAVSLLSVSSAFASAIREFDIKTLEKPGNDLARVIQQPDRGAYLRFYVDIWVKRTNENITAVLG